MFALTGTERQDAEGGSIGTAIELYTDEVAIVPGQNTAIVQWRMAGTVPWQTLTPDPFRDASRWKLRFDLPWSLDGAVDLRVMVTPPAGQATFSRSVIVKLA